MLKNALRIEEIRNGTTDPHVSAYDKDGIFGEGECGDGLGEVGSHDDLQNWTLKDGQFVPKENSKLKKIASELKEIFLDWFFVSHSAQGYLQYLLKRIKDFCDDFVECFITESGIHAFVEVEREFIQALESQLDNVLELFRQEPWQCCLDDFRDLIHRCLRARDTFQLWMESKEKGVVTRKLSCNEVEGSFLVSSFGNATVSFEKAMKISAAMLKWDCDPTHRFSFRQKPKILKKGAQGSTVAKDRAKHLKTLKQDWKKLDACLQESPFYKEDLYKDRSGLQKWQDGRRQLDSLEHIKRVFGLPSDGLTEKTLGKLIEERNIAVLSQLLYEEA